MHTFDLSVVDVAGLYSQAVGASYEESNGSEDIDMDVDSLDGSEQYVGSLKKTKIIVRHIFK